MQAREGKGRRWKARWIWSSHGGRERNVYYCFRREFTLDDPPDKAELRITADTRYRLTINGSLVGDGPPFSQPYLTYYDERDVGPLLAAGANVLAVVVHHLGTAPDIRGGFLMELDVDGETVAVSDRSWRVRKADAWAENTFGVMVNVAAPFQEVMDSRLEPEGWMEPGFDASGWEQATELATTRGIVSKLERITDPPAVLPWSRLVPRDIPFMETSVLKPRAITCEEECLAVDHRVPVINLAMGLSTVGAEIEHSALENPGAVLEGGRGRMTASSSTVHMDHRFDGVYDPCVVYDFGRVITAYMEIEIDGPAGGMVDIGYVERLIDGRFNNSLECQFADRFVLPGGRRRFRSFNWRGFRYVKVRFRECYSEAVVTALHAVVTTYPYREQGSFSCDAEELARIWRMSRYTIRLCSHEFLMDTPWREQGQWLGDVAAVTLGGIYACFGDTAAAAKFLRQSAANQLFTGFITNRTNSLSYDWRNCIVDYSLFWIQALWEHYMYSGDEELVHRLYPTALKILFAFLDYIDEHGLIDTMPYWIFIDWAGMERRGECAALNALFYGTLESVRSMAELKEDAYVLRLVDGLAAGIRESFSARLFDAGKGCFADANVDGALSERVSEHANMLAVQHGLCGAEAAHRIVDRLFVEQTMAYTRAEPYFTWQTLKALDRIGRFDLALEIVGDRWGMMLARGATSCSEEWGINGSWRAGERYGTFQRTESHAWSACPAEFLTKRLIGLEIVEPGCRRVRLSPRLPAGLERYEVSYPTPLGPIRVARRGARVDVELPAGMESE